LLAIGIKVRGNIRDNLLCSQGSLRC